MSTYVRNKETGEKIAVANETAQKLVQSGTHDFAQDKVNVVKRTGEVGTATSKVAGDFIDAGEVALEDDAHAEHRYQVQEDKKEFGGFSAQGLAESALSGATLGLSDIALRGLGFDPEEMRKRREYGTGTMVAGLAGAIIPGLLTGGAGAAGSLARLTPAGRAAMLAGEVGEGLVGGGLRGALASGAVEGALFGGGQGVSKVALSDDPVSGEAIVSEVGSGALYGAALGGVAGGVGYGAGQLLKRGSSALKGHISRMESRLSSKMGLTGEDVAVNAGSKASRRAASKADEALDLPVFSGADDVGKLSKLDDIHPPGVGVDDVLDETLTNANTPLGAQIDGYRVVAKNVRAGAKLRADKGVTTPELDDAWKAYRKTYDDFADKFGTDAAAAKTITENPRAAAQALRDFEEQSVKTWNAVAQRSRAEGRIIEPIGSVGDLLGAGYNPTTLIDDIANRVDDVSVAGDTFEEIAKQSVNQFDLSEFDDVTGLGSLADDAAEAAAKAKTPGKSHGFDVLDAVGVADYAGDQLGVDPVPGAVGNVLQARMLLRRGGIARKLARKIPGGSLAAKLFGGGEGVLSQLRFSAAKRLDTAIEKVLRGGNVAKGVAPKAAAILGNAKFGEDHDPPKGKGAAASFMSRANELAWATSNPELFKGRVRQGLQRIAITDPALADQMLGTAERKVQVLSQGLPPRPEIGNVLQGKNKWRPSKTQIENFAKLVHAVDNPVGTLEKAASGKITLDEVNAIRQVYPEMYASMQAKLIDRAAELQKELPYKRRIHLSTLFDVPLDSAMRPEFIASMQKLNAPVPESAGPTPQQVTGMRGAKMSAITPPEPTAAQRQFAR